MKSIANVFCFSNSPEASVERGQGGLKVPDGRMGLEAMGGNVGGGRVAMRPTLGHTTSKPKKATFPEKL